jgi:hypothetical protein
MKMLLLLLLLKSSSFLSYELTRFSVNDYALHTILEDAVCSLFFWDELSIGAKYLSTNKKETAVYDMMM